MRFRQYHRGRPDEGFTNPEVWLEFKPVEQFTRKTRYRLNPESMPALLGGDAGDVTVADKADGYLQRLLAAGVRPVFATLYQRLVFATPDETSRFTVVRDLGYFSLPEHSSALASSCTLGPPFASEDDVRLEIKWSRAPPDWAVTVARFLRPYAMEEGDRKFVLGLRQLLGLPSFSTDLSLPPPASEPRTGVQSPGRVSPRRVSPLVCQRHKRCSGPLARAACTTPPA